jgi:uncharacterized membrane protein YcaP (DUF421 family)
MWIFDTTLLDIAFRTAVIYLVVLGGLRLLGKRETGQMTPLDLVLLLLLANAVQNAMTGPDTSLTGGIVAAATLLTVTVVTKRFGRRRGVVRGWLVGTPRLLIRSGEILRENLDKEGLSVDELHQALREHGVATVREVALAVLELDGSISVLKDDELPRSRQPHHRIRIVRHA